MTRALVLQHLGREEPALIADVCTARGLRTEVRRLDLGDEVPPRLAADDILIVMGGPMGVRDLEDPRFPFLRREVELLRAVLRSGRAVLGICLGAQLVAHAAGARVFRNRRRDEPEVGFGEVRLLGQANEPVLAGLPSPLPVLHWHGDTFDLPPNAVRLAESDACLNQAFRLGRRAFGLQFHVEVGAELVRLWAEEDADFVRAGLGPDGPATIVRMSDEAVATMRAPARRLIENILGAMA